MVSAGCVERRGKTGESRRAGADVVVSSGAVDERIRRSQTTNAFSVGGDSTRTPKTGSTARIGAILTVEAQSAPGSRLRGHA